MDFGSRFIRITARLGFSSGVVVALSHFRMRVLVVEDEPTIRSQLCKVLRGENYAVDEAEDGEVALYKVAEWPYDLVVLDVMMPNIDGFEVVRCMREKKIDAAVLILTARGGVEDRVRGLDLGADDYLKKGFELQEFKARVRALLRRKKQVFKNKLRARDVELDLATGQVEKAGRPVNLTGREYAILVELMSQPGAVVPRHQLYEGVVDESDDSISNPLEVHVCNLRRKLGKDFVRTFRGRGYALNVESTE